MKQTLLSRPVMGILALTLLASMSAEAKKQRTLMDLLFGGGEQPQQQQQQPQYVPPQQIDFNNDPWADVRNNNDAPPRNLGGDGNFNINNGTVATVGADGMTEKQKEQMIIGEFRSQPNSGQKMRVTKTEWTEEDENLYGQFVAQIGRAVRDGVCSTVKGCMRNSQANMFRNSDNPSLVLYSDCADFPYFTRAYFASKMGLPFSYAGELALLQAPVASLPNRQEDLAQSLVDGRLDNSPYGNIITGRAGNNIPQAIGQNKTLEVYLENMFDVVSTRTFRVGPLNPSTASLDTYPVAINKDGIRTGTILVSTGHIGTVFQVDNEGSVHFVDAHPDGSLSFKMVKPSTLDRSRPEHGLGFYRFRNVRVSGGAYDRATGEIYGGRAVPVSNEELVANGKYSLEQYFGPNSYVRPDQFVSPTLWSSSFSSPSFFDYLAQKLRGQGVWIDADQSVVKLMDSLCSEIKQRVKDIDVALNAGTPSIMHPETLPSNIFSTPEETWENQSSPGRDGRMRASVSDIYKAAIGQWQLYKAPGTGVRFKGGNSAAAFRDAMRRELQAMDSKCQISYRKSDGSSKTLTFSDVLSRLNKLSFDPYHCAEKRWGASGQELATCRDTDRGNVWYDAQTLMRNYQGKANSSEKLVIRSTTPITLSMLQQQMYIDQPDSALNNLGYTRAPLMNLDAAFASERFMQSLDSGL